MRARERIRQFIFLIGPGHRNRWILVAVLACFSGIVETVGATLIFVLVGSIAQPESAVNLPLLGDLRSFFPEYTDRRFVLTLSFLIFGFFVFRGTFFIAARYVENRIAQHTGVRLSTRLFHGYMRMPYALHLRRNSSEIIRNVQGATAETVHAIFTPAARLASEILTILGILVALVLASPLATAGAAVLLLPVVFAMLKIVQPRMTSYGQITHAEGKTGVKCIQESMQNLRDVRILGRESYFERIYRESRIRLARAAYLRAVLSELPRLVFETILVLFILVFLAIMIALERSLSESLALLGLFTYAGLRTLPSITRVVGNLNSFRYGVAALETVHSDLVSLESVHMERSKKSLAFRKTISFDSVSYTYPGSTNPVLKDVSLDVHRGEHVGIVGSTGGGKSTLIDVLIGLLEPSRGKVTLDAMPIHGDPQAWQRSLGFVSQSVFLLDDSIRKNIALGLDDHDIDEDRVLYVIEIAQLKDFVRTLPDGIDTVVGERGVRVSGGQRQRIAIARALYLDPPVLIFDEATSALDNRTESKLIETIVRLSDRTIIMVAHRLSTLRNCDKIYVLEDGRVVDTGSLDELMAKGSVFEKTSERKNREIAVATTAGPERRDA